MNNYNILCLYNDNLITGMARLKFLKMFFHQLFSRSSLSFSLLLRRSESVTLEGSHKESLGEALGSLGKSLGSLGGGMLILILLDGSITSISHCSVSWLLM